MFRRREFLASLVCFACVLGGAARADSVDLQRQRLLDATAGRVDIRIDPATDAARFIRIQPGSLTLDGSDATARSRDFFERFGGVVGVDDPATQLVALQPWTDAQGMTHVRQRQVHRGVSVFGGELRTHFDAAGRMTAVNGTFVPGISVDPTPRRPASAAAAVAPLLLQ